jgi:hypothetical protein
MDTLSAPDMSFSLTNSFKRMAPLYVVASAVPFVCGILDSLDSPVRVEEHIRLAIRTSATLTAALFALHISTWFACK